MQTIRTICPAFAVVDIKFEDGVQRRYINYEHVVEIYDRPGIHGARIRLSNGTFYNVEQTAADLAP